MECTCAPSLDQFGDSLKVSHGWQDSIDPYLYNVPENWDIVWSRFRVSGHYDMLATSQPNLKHSSLARKLRRSFCLGRGAEHVSECDRCLSSPRSSACYLEKGAPRAVEWKPDRQ
jgi:hypothetical protein